MRGKIKYFIAIIFVLAAVIFIMSRVLIKNNQSNFMNGNEPYVRINSIDIPVEVANNDASRQKGLSSRTSLDAQSGMLFIFDKPEIPTFWMPNMNFPIDIIWINDNKVIDISPNVSNNFDPKNPRLYSPSQPAKYVLETNAGFSEKENIKIGDPMSLINIK